MNTASPQWCWAKQIVFSGRGGGSLLSEASHKNPLVKWRNIDQPSVSFESWTGSIGSAISSNTKLLFKILQKIMMLIKKINI